MKNFHFELFDNLVDRLRGKVLGLSMFESVKPFLFTLLPKRYREVFLLSSRWYSKG